MKLNIWVPYEKIETVWALFTKTSALVSNNSNGKRRQNKTCTNSLTSAHLHTTHFLDGFGSSSRFNGPTKTNFMTLNYDNNFIMFRVPRKNCFPSEEQSLPRIKFFYSPFDKFVTQMKSEKRDFRNNQSSMVGKLRHRRFLLSKLISPLKYWMEAYPL